MKKLSALIVLLLISVPAFAQVVLQQNNSRNAVAAGVSNLAGNTSSNNNLNALKRPSYMPTTSDSQGVHIKTLSERRQEQQQRQQAIMQRSGLRIQNIAPQNQGVTNFQPNNVQSLPNQQLQQRNIGTSINTGATVQ